MYSEAVLPSGFDNIIADGILSTEGGRTPNNLLVVFLITSPVQADITCFEPFPNISELRVQLALALACADEKVSRQAEKQE